MELNTAAIRRNLKEANLKSVFVDELGWDIHSGAALSITAKDIDFDLVPIAVKRGVQIFECSSMTDGTIPDRAIRQKIERDVTKTAREHLIVFMNRDRTEQVWQWVAREPGRPAALREQRYARQQSGDALIQKLQHIAIPLDEEEAMSLTGVTQKLKDAFDKDKVTKKFYARFKTEHGNFLKLISGFENAENRDWYASLMVNRLMFIYFIEKKGFLDGDQNYLRNRLGRMQQRRKDKFHTFYRHFLMRLFHEGLGHQPPRSSELDELLGNVPYLNGGLFDVHELEDENTNIEIPDRAFEALFDFFDDYEWHLDDRPLREGNEINPDVLGYIFEKYINQKQMGAYYTKEDITEYISKNTVIPHLFDDAEKDCAIAFRKDGALWGLLRDDPDRFIYPAVRKGVDEPLPANVAAGIKNVAKRTDWNRPAGPEHALPTETWREHIARRQRCLEVRVKLRAGKVTSVNELITLNLDIRQFAQDVIERSEGPELIRAFFKAIRGITVLDPAVGSGAFLFAALNILQPLYDACLDRMKAFVEDAEERGETDARLYADFREELARVAKHPSREYYVLKSIVITNLYGVDIMEEAVEICKLRLFLKLVAQLERPEEIEPLPDMDFNIRAGNTLVGFTSIHGVKEAMTVTRKGQARMLSMEQEEELASIEKNASVADELFQKFHAMQGGEGIDEGAFALAKSNVRKWLDELRERLDHHLAREYGIDPDKDGEYEPWQRSHQPFHWFVEFYGIMRRGGFDVVIGNPPYLEQSKLGGAYEIQGLVTRNCRNIYAWMLERSTVLLNRGSRLGHIVPVSIVSSESFEPLREVILGRLTQLWASHFANRPGQLFEGAQNRLTIIHGCVSDGNGEVYSTKYHRWDAKDGERAALFQSLAYVELGSLASSFRGLLPKVGSVKARSVLQKILERQPVGELLARRTSYLIHWVRVPGYFCQFFLDPPMVYPEDGGPARQRGELRSLHAPTEKGQLHLHAALNSSTYIQFFSAFTDGRHINPTDVREFRLGTIDGILSRDLLALSAKLRKKMTEATTRRRKSGLSIESVDSRRVKGVLDQIDGVLGQHYGFDEEELDFIINYDIKYRMGGADRVDGDGD